MTPHSQILDHWSRVQSFLLATHVNPDGDAIGSMLGLAHVLDRWGKSGHLLLPQGVPERFSWLNPPWPIVSAPDRSQSPCVVALDCGDLSRVDTEDLTWMREQDLVNIDHHTGNPMFGGLNWVDPDRSSVGEMVAVMARSLELPLRGDLADAIYLAILADTGSLSYSNTTAQTLDIVSEILAQGLDMDRFQANMQRQWRLNTLHLHGRAMQDITVHAQGRIGIIRATQAMLQETETGPEDCDGLVNYVRSLQGVLVAISLRQVQDGVKFSLRTWGEVDVQVIAAALGGGGHPNAAGGLLSTSMAEAEEQLIQTIIPCLPSSGGA